MKIDRIYDMAFVKEVMMHPSIWRHIHDDGVSEPAPQNLECLYWLAVSDEERKVGFFLVYQTNSFCFEMHTALLPEIWGEKANQAAQLLLKWVFQNTVCEKIITLVPDDNKVAKRFALRNGMQIEGVNRASFKKDGRLLDQTMLGITKEEWTKCQ